MAKTGRCHVWVIDFVGGFAKRIDKCGQTRVICPREFAHVMPRDPQRLTDVIWSGSFGFVGEGRYHDLHISPLKFAGREHFDRYLADTKRLPELDGAPIASWFLARLARLAGRRFPFSPGDVIGSDGADYSLRFICISKSVTPVGLLGCFGSIHKISLSLGFLSNCEPNAVFDAFTEAVLQQPADVAQCRLIVQYTEMTDPKVAFHVPKVYGWDGRKYLDEEAPEHMIDPSEYE